MTKDQKARAEQARQGAAALVAGVAHRELEERPQARAVARRVAYAEHRGDALLLEADYRKAGLGQFAHCQLALLWTCTDQRAQCWLDEAQALARLPQVWQALASGRLGVEQAGMDERLVVIDRQRLPHRLDVAEVALLIDELRHGPERTHGQRRGNRGRWHARRLGSDVPLEVETGRRNRNASPPPRFALPPEVP